MRKQTRTVIVMLAALAALATAAVVAAATVVVAPGHTNGWTSVNDSCGAATTGSIAFVSGPASPPAGAGSVQFTVGSNGDSYPTLRTSDFNGVKLNDLTSLDYWTYVSHTGSGGQAPYIDLYVDFNNNGTRDDILTFEPIYSPSQASVTPNTWQHWNALTGNWWAESSGGPPPLFTLASYIASHPDARILATTERSLILAAGCGGAAWTSFVGNADKLTVGVKGVNTTFDFEPTTQVAQPSHKVTICHNGHTISVDEHAVPAHVRHGDHIGPC